MILLIAVVLALILLIYLPSLNAGPTYDDSQYFLDPELKKWDWKWWKSWYNRSLSTATIRATFCFVPDAYHVQVLHATNMVLHFLNAVCVYGIAGKPEAMLLFAVSPLATSAVCPVATRATLLSTTFSFAALWLALSGHPFVGLLFMIPAIHSREDSIFMLPVMMLVSPWTFSVPVIVAGLTGAAIFQENLRYILWHKITRNGDEGMSNAGFDESFPQPTYTITSFTENVLRWIPWNLGLIQNPDPNVKATGPAYCGLALMVFSIGVTAVALLKLQILAIVLILLSPWTASWFFRLPDAVAESRAYTTIAGFAMIVAALNLPIWLFTALIAALALTATYRTYQRRHGVPYWKAAWRPKNPKLRVAVNIAANYQTIGDMQQAMEWHAKAFEIASTNGIVLANMGLWHEGMARIARRDVANDLVQVGMMDAKKAKDCHQRSVAHLQQALHLMSLGLFYCDKDPMVRLYADKVKEHAKMAGIPTS